MLFCVECQKYGCSTIIAEDWQKGVRKCSE